MSCATVSHWKGVDALGKKRKLSTYGFVDPLRSPEATSFCVLANPTLQVLLDEIQVDAKLNFVEEPVKILDRQFKKLKRSRIAIVKVW
ncbi:hypothetical protein Tco_1291922 [Tanacetum coccineum]